MEEIVPGVFYWATFHERIRHTVSSYYAVRDREAVLIDPRVPEEGLEWFEERVVPKSILLTNRHHYRQSDQFVTAFGCTVRSQRAGLHEFRAGQEVQGFDFGDRFACDIVAFEVGNICPDETALYLPWARTLAFADGLVRMPFDGPLGFVPDMLMGDDPPAVKAGLKQAFGVLLNQDFDTILLAHGAPWVGGAKEALRAFVESAEPEAPPASPSPGHPSPGHPSR
jgi:hypothetical protein